MLGWDTVLVEQERRKDMLREVAMDRLSQEALAVRHRGESLYCQALTRLGAWLVASGRYLQKRYGVVPGPAKPLAGRTV
jgi:hypothetical protein